MQLLRRVEAIASARARSAARDTGPDAPTDRPCAAACAPADDTTAGVSARMAARRIVAEIVARLGETARTAAGLVKPRKRDRAAGSECERNHMKWVSELDGLFATSAPDAKAVAAFNRWMDCLRSEHPNKWVVYSDRRGESDATPVFRVLRVFDDEGEADDWARTLPPDELDSVTVHYTDAQ